MKVMMDRIKEAFINNMFDGDVDNMSDRDEIVLENFIEDVKIIMDDYQIY
jgi:hypothetical protein